jgi:hypothetical protein
MSNFNCLQQYFLRYNQNAKPPGADRVLLIRKRPKGVIRKKDFMRLKKWKEKGWKKMEKERPPKWGAKEG